ncbi:hypothetical protein [Odoribacter laneus]|uniref:Uncharacterized protein n=1 Tax=Odoribacter laneus YIT 12061 TaxID=742817 RepID=H1DHM7_9BACT|nr:hypothetical protein [Odoribacter laneus]EHP47156.1 hypothetical protein HMPREF9449_01763 [Odoribacter laneus YIT 12061]
MGKITFKKVCKYVVGGAAIVTGGALIAAAATGAAPFDRGYTWRCVGNSITSQGPNVLNNVLKWMKE